MLKLAASVVFVDGLLSPKTPSLCSSILSNRLTQSRKGTSLLSIRGYIQYRRRSSQTPQPSTALSKKALDQLHSSFHSPSPFRCYSTSKAAMSDSKAAMSDTGTPQTPVTRSFGEVRVVTYNVLCSSLSPPDYFTHCKPENLKPDTRYKRIVKKLTPELEQKSIICLQEVSLAWVGRFHAFFQDNGYYFVTTNYAGKSADYMGVAIAFPTALYGLEDCSVVRLVDFVRWKRKPVSLTSRLLAPVSSITKIPSSVFRKLGFGFKVWFPRMGGEDWFETGRRRYNQCISLKLNMKESGRSFCIACYHMPCMFKLPKVMAMHAALACQYIQKTAGKLPYIIAGDWNITPNDPVYELLTTTQSSSIELDLPQYETWKPVLNAPVKSAYKEVNGVEPEFTNNAKIRDEPDFVDTLDYIFYSEGWQGKEVLGLNSKDSISGPYPDKNEPSDHLMLRCTFTEVPGK